MLKLRFLIFIFFAIALHNQVRNGDITVFFKNPNYAGVIANMPDGTSIVSFETPNGRNDIAIIPLSKENIDETIPMIDVESTEIPKPQNTESPIVPPDKVSEKPIITPDNPIIPVPTPVPTPVHVPAPAITLPKEIGMLSSLFGDDNTIIGCITRNTPFEIRKPNDKGNCFYGGGPWMNIALPPKSHLTAWTSIYPSFTDMIDAFPVVNLESSFNEGAKLYVSDGKYYRNPPFNGAVPFVHGYVQTKYVYGISPDPKSQLSWMKNRMDSQIVGNCSQWKDSGEDRLLRCLYARHRGDSSGYAWYPSFNMKVRDYYLSYFQSALPKIVAKQ